MKRVATITVIGRDKTGVIARVTNFLFESGANIEALEEQVTRGQFSMVLQASWKKASADLSRIQKDLSTLGRSIGMEIRLRAVAPHSRQRFALFATREPHCLKAILSEHKRHRIRATPSIVIANHTDLEPIASEYGVPFRWIPWENRTAAETTALELLEQEQVDFIVLARFMKILSPNFVWRYKNKIINIHPSLLPSFPGPQPYRQAYERGVKMAGVTAHFVTMHLDEGPIIAQGSFPVRPGMTLKQMIEAGQRQESIVLLKAIRLYLGKRLDVHWGVVKEI